MSRGIVYGFYQDVRHYFLLKEKEEMAKRGDCPIIRRMRRDMNSPLPPDALPVATKFGEWIARMEEDYESSLVTNIVEHPAN
jgi:hypothetical protein